MISWYHNIHLTQEPGRVQLVATTGPDGKVRYVKRPAGAPGGPYSGEPGEGWDSEGRPIQEDHYKTHGQVGNNSLKTVLSDGVQLLG